MVLSVSFGAAFAKRGVAPLTSTATKVRRGAVRLGLPGAGAHRLRDALDPLYFHNDFMGAPATSVTAAIAAPATACIVAVSTSDSGSARPVHVSATPDAVAATEVVVVFDSNGGGGGRGEDVLPCGLGDEQLLVKRGVVSEQLVALLTLCSGGGSGLYLRNTECVAELDVVDSAEPGILLVSDGRHLGAYGCHSLGSGDGGGVDVP
mmetsp:Transcript_14190/g.34419  ORF Transcript_14190/g.34419 Transcript_14190/m.34419 type:complete len:206 (-) Transcript_14190:196-813(-)